jgi:LmbE family N-acetylglucosaminyl deacetylase
MMTEQNEFYAPERVLIIVAHADDIEFGMGGTVARWTAAGTQVTYCIVTDNSSGSNDPAMTRERLIEIRQQEQIAAAKVLGVEDVRFLDYPDGQLEHTLELRRELTRLIRQVRPQIVATMDPTTIFAPNSDYINHPDHRASAEAAIYAVFPSSETRLIFPELIVEGLEPHRVNQVYLNFSLQPNLYVDTSTTWEHKIESLLAHKSQVGEQVRDWIRQADMEVGKAGGYEMAESFRVMTVNRDEPIVDKEV